MGASSALSLQHIGGWLCSQAAQVQILGPLRADLGLLVIGHVTPGGCTSLSFSFLF